MTTDGTSGSQTYGQKIAESGHFPYGESWYEGGGTNKFKFTSYERDGESGNDFAIFRYYSNRNGRFCSADPLGRSISDPQSLNRFAYVGNDPVNRVDPLGLECVQVCTGPEGGPYECEEQCFDDPPVETQGGGGGGVPFGWGDFSFPQSGLVFPDFAPQIADPPFPPLPDFLNTLPQGPAPPPPLNPCAPFMLRAFDEIWNRTVRIPQDRVREAGRSVDIRSNNQVTASPITLGPPINPRIQNPYVNIPFDQFGLTIALIHGHPTGNGSPSDADRLSRYPNYIVSLFTVVVTDPRNPTPAGDRTVITNRQRGNQPCNNQGR